MACGASWADQAPLIPQDPTNPDLTAGQKPITKVKPAPPPITKVKPAFTFPSLPRFSPLSWGFDCCLPSPAPRQFVAGAGVMFARVQGDVSKGGSTFFGDQFSLLNFDDTLGIPKNGNVMWRAFAHYQVTPRWGVRYSFSPISLEGSSQPSTSFTWLGQQFGVGMAIRSKWERFEHRAGLVFDVSRTPGSVASVYAEWIYIQDRVKISNAFGGTLSAPVWDDDKSLVQVGLEVNKCLKNFKGSTLALNCKAGVSFLSDNSGFDLEAGVSYIVPIRTGRFGFVKGGYRFANLKKDKTYEVFKTTMDGAFVEAGFIF